MLQNLETNTFPVINVVFPERSDAVRVMRSSFLPRPGDTLRFPDCVRTVEEVEFVITNGSDPNASPFAVPTVSLSANS